MTNMARTKAPYEVKVLPKLARVTNADGFYIGDEIKLTYMGEAGGWKNFLIGTHFSATRTSPPGFLKAQFDHKYEVLDVVVATNVGEVNGELLWAFHPRQPRFIEVPSSILANTSNQGYIWFTVHDPDNPHVGDYDKMLIQAESGDMNIVTVSADDQGNVKYFPQNEGETSIRLHVLTSTGQDWVDVPIRVDFHPPSIWFTPSASTLSVPWNVFYLGEERSFQFQTALPSSSFIPVFETELLKADPSQEMGEVRVEINPHSRTLVAQAAKPGNIIVRLNISNAEKPCYSDLYLMIRPLNSPRTQQRPYRDSNVR